MKAEYVTENSALRNEMADAHAVLDAAGVGETSRRLSERVGMLHARTARLQSDLTAALNIAEDSAKQCARLRGSLTALVDYYDRAPGHQPDHVIYKTLARLMREARAALAPKGDDNA
jgi:hypothetical protein